MSSTSDDEPGTLRCRLFTCKWDTTAAVGVLWEVCSRCGRSRKVSGDSDD